MIMRHDQKATRAVDMDVSEIRVDSHVHTFTRAVGAVAETPSIISNAVFLNIVLKLGLSRLNYPLSGVNGQKGVHFSFSSDRPRKRF